MAAKLQVTIGVSALALAWAAPVHAQTADSEGRPEIVVNATRAVTATKTDTPILEIPQSITVVTNEQIKEQGGLTLIQGLNYTAGVTNAGEDTRGDFNAVRGFQSVLFLDGLKRNFGFVYTPRPDINTLERVEVLLGPSAVLYGAGSSGGLINLQSKKPQFDFGGSLSANVGTFNRKEAIVDVTGPLSDTVAARFVGVVRDANQLVRLTPDNRVVLQGSLTWRPTEATSITALGLYQKDRVGPSQYAPIAAALFAGPDQPRVNRRTLLGEPTFNRGPKEDRQATLLIDHSFSEAISVHSSTRYQSAFTSYGEIYGEYFGSGNGPTDPFIDAADTTIARSIFAIRANYRSFTTENHVEINAAHGDFEHKLLFGVDYSYFRQLSRQAFSFAGATPLNIYNPVYGAPQNVVFAPQQRQMIKQLGFYGQDQVRYKDIVSLVVGVRRDRVRTEDTFLPTVIDKATTWRVGLTVNVTPEIAPYASFAQSFQPFAGLNQFGTPYRPLKGEQYEAGVKWQPSRSTLLRASYYQIKEDNYLRPDPANPLNSIQSGSVKSKGFEFQADHRVPGDITLTVSYAHNSTRASGEGRQQDQTPRDTASAFATKTFELGEYVEFRLGGGVRHVAKQVNGSPTAGPLFPQVVLPSYTIVDAVAAVDYKNWTLQLNVINLFDKFYYSQCNAFGGCGNGDPQTFNASLTYRF